ncbi:MAG: sensor histidine kinase [Woeseiaceae bacterium]
MLPHGLLKDYDERRLRNLLGIVFMALVIPTAVIIWLAYGQLKWEAFYQYRAQAEALTNRIDSVVAERVALAESRSFADFAFLNLTQSGKILQRSPLAAFPVTQDFPGALGYFQVDADGAFSTPLLPARETDLTSVGIAPEEYANRAALADLIQQILADNSLVRDRATGASRLLISNESTDLPEDAAPATPMASVALKSVAEDVKEDADSVGRDRDDTAFASSAEPKFRQVEEPESRYTQQVFDQLNASTAPAPANSPSLDTSAQSGRRENSLGRLQDLELDENLQKKTEALNRTMPELLEEKIQSESVPLRGRRTEQVALPETVALEDEFAGSLTAGEAAQSAITTFSSEIDPYEFSLLDSGHSVLFRKVWRNGDRYIQGLLIDQNRFAENVIATAFRETTLAGMSDLIIGYQDDIISVVNGTTAKDYLGSSGPLQGTLLYRRSLSTPLDRLEMVFSIKQMPSGPGAGVLAWSTLIIAIVFLAGFLALYRLGSSQIRLARQQQDFVSAVSHELKTPLTSIRMYGEMLKEGWADEAKQKQYYEYIHDESERLTRLISNVLQLAKITRNAPDFNLQSIAVGELMSQIESKITSQVERAGFALNIARDTDSDGRNVQVDVDCFTQVVINLVDNAIKFSRDADDKAIDISARLSAEGTIVFTVRDFGPGIPKDQMKKIFQLFYRTESELTRETVGTGIGLAIVHQLVTAMHGRVDVTNQDPGAQFDVSFPTI